MKHLELSDLDRWHAFRLKIAERHQGFCVSLLTGRATPEDLQDGIAELDEGDLHEFGKLIATGIRRKVMGIGDPTTHMNHLTSAIQTISLSLSDEDQARLGKAILGQASGEETCWATKVLMTGLSKLPDNERALALKATSGIL